MMNTVFGELVFDNGWKTSAKINLFGRACDVTIKVSAYFEKDGITPEQEKACLDFDANRVARLAVAEKLLNDYADGNGKVRFSVQMLVFERNGSYALLLDAEDDEDGGVAVCLAPMEKAIPLDAYL